MLAKGPKGISLHDSGKHLVQSKLYSVCIRTNMANSRLRAAVVSRLAKNSLYFMNKMAHLYSLLSPQLTTTSTVGAGHP
jgi:hypothetical protein